MSLPNLMRVCSTCGRALPVDFFNHNGSVCDDCYQTVELHTKTKEIRKQAKDAFAAILSQVRPDRINAPHISEVCAGLVDELGGLDEMCKLLADDYRCARENNPGSQTVAKMGDSLLRLIKESSVLRGSAPDAQGMTDEQLAGELLNLFHSVAKNADGAIESDDIMLEMLEDSIGDS